MSVIRSVVQGCGLYLPTHVMTNDDFVARGLDTTDEWIFQRTGIKKRHIAAEGEFTSDLALAAARQALEKAQIAVDEVDLVIVATTSPDATLPATAARVQDRLGMTRGFAFDLQAACSGFVYALSVADNFIKTGQVKTAIVIGAETLSRIVDWTDRSTCVLFGDGAGAVVLRAQEGKGDASDRGVLSTHLHSDGSAYDSLKSDGGPSSTQTTGFIRMQGKEVFRRAVTCLSNVVDEALTANNLQPEQIDLLVPHQANMRIIEGTAKKLHMAMDRVVVTVDQHANTSAASIPLALATAEAEGRIRPGQLILLDGMGAGLTWGAAAIRW